ncbi:MAG TPA: sodium:proton antiporter [Thermoanaerobaculia bacterium]|jgi:CPA1 family monovalent cation:H+ antiporter
MAEFEALLGVLLVATVLASVARRAGAPYPAFLALGGAVLAFVPGAPRVSIDPAVALALFVAPVLLDAAYDTSPRDLRDHWVPVTSLAVVSVILTTIAVAVVVRRIVPGMPLAAAVALGAIVAPPDAAAATAVLRQLRPPHRILTILEGESLLNDATALLIYRLAVTAVAMSAFSVQSAAPSLLLILAGSAALGLGVSWISLRVTRLIRDVPTAVIVQFVTTFGVWILADRLGLSAVLTMVCFAIAVARRAPASTPARIRIPSYAVWETAVFLLNVLAFILIGLQIRPILSSFESGMRARYLWVAGVVLATVIVVRIAWVMLHTSVAVAWIRRFGFHPRRPIQPPTLKGGVVVSWAGMRGIISLAAAAALPDDFPYRGLVVLIAFAVVLGTLVIQGLTLRPLIQWLELKDDDPVGREVEAARRRALEAALSSLDGDESPTAVSVREEILAHLTHDSSEQESEPPGASHLDVHRHALSAARRAVFDMRTREEIGDEAFHRLEEELDWAEMGVETRA